MDFFINNSGNMFSKLLFFFWLSAITFILLVDYSSISGLGLSKGFGTGFWLHAVGYFIAGLLFILAFGEKGQAYFLIALAALYKGNV